uniref:Ig-like domain-containing protein n=1 Tax=Gopherus agassizii TaxID=38772 RepID=A0A452J2N8_9SAUR
CCLELLIPIKMWLCYFSALADPALTAPREVSGPPGGTVSVPCQYGKRNQGSQKYWCRGAQWKSCSKVVETEKSEVKVKRGRVSITDNHTMSTFTVTTENLTLGDAGIYWCGINIKGGSDPHSLVNVTVLPGESLSLPGSASQLRAFAPLQSPAFHCWAVAPIAGLCGRLCAVRLLVTV